MRPALLTCPHVFTCPFRTPFLPPPAIPPGYDPSSIFHGSLVPYRVVTEWGGMSLVVAERLLLQAALQDPSNSRFLLVSDSGIPLYDPLTFYQQLMHEDKSRVKACRNGYLSDYRWHPVMAVRGGWGWMSRACGGCGLKGRGMGGGREGVFGKQARCDGAGMGKFQRRKRCGRQSTLCSVGAKPGAAAWRRSHGPTTPHA